MYIRMVNDLWLSPDIGCGCEGGDGEMKKDAAVYGAKKDDERVAKIWN